MIYNIILIYEFILKRNITFVLQKDGQAKFYNNMTLPIKN